MHLFHYFLLNPYDVQRSPGLEALFYSLVLTTTVHVMYSLLQQYETVHFPAVHVFAIRRILTIIFRGWTALVGLGLILEAL